MAKLKLNKKLIEEATRLVSAGNYIETVCQYLRISKETWYRWYRTGEQQNKGIFRDFYDAIKKAEATAEARNVAIIQDAAKTTWQAAAWYLERKFPNRWGRKDRTQQEEDSNIDKLIEIIQKSRDEEQ